MGLVICFIIIGHIWKKYYQLDILRTNWRILQDQKVWAHYMEAMPGFRDFKGGCVFHLVLALILVILSHFLRKISFLFFGIYGIHIAIQFQTYRIRSKYVKQIIDEANSKEHYGAAQMYRKALSPYLAADMVYCLYAVYLLVVSYIVYAIW